MAILADRVTRTDPMLPRFERVTRVEREGADLWTVEIAPREPFPFTPGQFNMLYAHGIGEAAISISGDPAEPERLVHTIRAVGRVSEALTRLRVGDVVGVRGPFGRGWPVDLAVGSDVVVVAGGLGLAPLRPAILWLLRERARIGRLAILCGMRGPADILFEHQLERWRGRLDVALEVTVDHAGTGWGGNVGVVTALIPRVSFAPARTVAFVCGPEIMMRYAAAELTRAGVPAERVFLSMERNMKCAIGFCGHCQFGGGFVCRDGPIYDAARIVPLLHVREL